MIKKTIIRSAVEGDADSLVRFNRAMARETENKELIENVISSGVKTLLRSPNLGFYVVAEVSETIVASLMVTMEWSDWRNGIFWWIQSVYVLPAYRRQGIYRKLYDYVKTRASKDPGVCGFRLYVEKENLPAQKTYEALNMEETDYKIYEELKENVKFIVDAS